MLASFYGNFYKLRADADMVKIVKKPGQYSHAKLKNSETEYRGNGWSVVKIGESYRFTYISGSLQGEEKSAEITKEDFEAARQGTLGFDEICAKYGVH